MTFDIKLLTKRRVIFYFYFKCTVTVAEISASMIKAKSGKDTIFWDTAIEKLLEK